MMKEANFYGVGGHRDAWHHFEPAPGCSWDALCVAKGQFRKVTRRQNTEISINIEYGSDFITMCIEKKSHVCPLEHIKKRTMIASTGTYFSDFLA